MKKQIYKTKVWDLPLYPGKLQVIITNDIDLIQDPIVKEILLEDHDSLYAHYVKGANDKGEIQHSIVLLSDLVKDKEYVHGLVAHESLHAVIEICDYVGIDIKADNPEPITYFLAWVVNRVYEVIKM